MLLLLLLQLTLILVLELLLLKTDLVKQRHFVVARGPTCQSAAAAPPAATRGRRRQKECKPKKNASKTFRKTFMKWRTNTLLDAEF